MITYIQSYKHRPMSVLAGGALFFGLLFASVPASADELPAFRRGMWEFHRTMAGKSTEARKCIDPTENILQKTGCTFSSIKKSENIYTFVAECPAENPTSPVLGGRSTVVLDVKSNSFYQVVSEGTVAGHPVKEYLDARRRSDCAK